MQRLNGGAYPLPQTSLFIRDKWKAFMDHGINWSNGNQTFPKNHLFWRPGASLREDQSGTPSIYSTYKGKVASTINTEHVLEEITRQKKFFTIPCKGHEETLWKQHSRNRSSLLKNFKSMIWVSGCFVCIENLHGDTSVSSVHQKYSGIACWSTT